MSFRDVADMNMGRTVVCSAIPRGGVGHTLSLFFTGPNISASQTVALLANLSSIVLDYLARQKISGLHMSSFLLEQLPIFPPSRYGEDELEFIIPRCLELLYTSEATRTLANDLGYDGPPFKWDFDRRSHLCAELDAFFAHLYGVTREELQYVLDPTTAMGEGFPSETFKVLKDEELATYGEYRTANLVLNAWDKFEQCGMSEVEPVF